MQDNATPHGRQLVEVWGDTADTRHLAWAIVLGITISLAGFFAASRVLVSHVASPDLARAYAMLAGLGGCLLSGVVCAMLFKPKRVVVEGQAADPYWRQEVLRQLEEQTGDLGRVADLPPEVVAEMKELQIYELFVEHEKRARTEQATTGASAALPAHAANAAANPAAITAQMKAA
ncbi:MAG: hypothetical protein JWP29_602 [Rhodoferax sp.]|nr:hypothetical protein [Rhodoferax sp.]